jgi:hypothetical protein
VPTYEQVHRAGWSAGQAIDIAVVVDGAELLPLRFQRVELHAADAVAGTPTDMPGTDPDTDAADTVTAVSTGDSFALGRIAVTGIDAISLRTCVPNLRATTGSLRDLANSDLVPLRISVHQDTPSGPELVHQVDAAHDAATFTRLAAAGFGETCWRIVHLPVTGQVIEAAPELFLTVDLALPGTVQLNSVDFDGTGARSPAAPNWVTPDPAGTRTLFDGSSFEGWDQSGCAIRDGAATNARTGDRTQTAGCSLTERGTGANRVIRLDIRAQNFYDNGGINLPNEIQIRRAGEWGPGGYFTGYAARWNKLNAWPAWSQMEIIQLGARYVVRINGRTVTDYTSAAAPAPYPIKISTDPRNSNRLDAGEGFGAETQPDLTTPDEWGGYWFRHIRAYQCTAETDPVCTHLLTINEGQAPPR